MAMSGIAISDTWTYTPPLSLWKLVEQTVSPEEQEEIRSMLGTSLIENTLDLHNEVNTLLDIWRDYQEETDAISCSLPTLAEPPLVRERLVQEICFLAESVRAKSSRKGMDPAAFLSKHKSHILDYAEETMRSGSSLGSARPMSARSSDGRQTPLVPSHQASSQSELSITINEDVSSAAERLNYLQFEEVCSRLRETLTKEMEQLEADVVFLQGCLDDAADRRSHGGSPTLSREPTIKELREERSQLEKDLQSAESMPRTPAVNKPPFIPGSGVPEISKGLQQLGTVKGKLRPAQTTSTSEIGRNLPLKAAHPIPSPVHSSDSESASPDSTTLHASGSTSVSKADAKMSQRMQVDNQDSKVVSSSCGQTSKYAGGDSYGRHYNSHGKEEITKTHEMASTCQRRIPSAASARAKVVPVGSVLGLRADSPNSRHLLPTPPPEEDRPPLSRPNSAQRFRKMVMQYRDSTE